MLVLCIWPTSLYQGSTNLPKKSRRHPQNSRPHKSDGKQVPYCKRVLGAIVQNLVATATWRQGFVNVCLCDLGMTPEKSSNSERWNRSNK